VRFLYYVENVLILSLFLNENTVLILKKLEYEACSDQVHSEGACKIHVEQKMFKVNNLYELHL
jgi:hypothetical protein